VAWDVKNLPAWAAGSAEQFFQVAEHATSPFQIAFTEWKVSLPREMSREEQLAAVKDFLDAAFGDNHPYVYAVHDPMASDGGRNPHAHVIWSARTLDGYERPPERFFMRYDRVKPERGGAENDRVFGHFGAVKATRILYTDVMNVHLERGGYEARLHPDALEMRGFDRIPEPHVYPSDSRALKVQGRITDRMRNVMMHRRQYAPDHHEEQYDASRYWEGRCARLGLTRELSYADALRCIQEARHTLTHHPMERLSLDVLQAEQQQLAAEIASLETYIAEIEAVQQGAEVPIGTLMRLLAGRHLDEGTGAGLRMKLYERDEGYGR